MCDHRERLIQRIELAERQLKQFMLRDRGHGLLSIDLSIQQLRVLMLLAVDGGSSAHQLADSLGVGLTTVTGIVDRLERRGLVSRQIDPRDRRVRRIELTGEGRKLIEDFESLSRQHRQSLYGRLELRILGNLAECLEAMHAALTSEAEEPSGK
jgi:DNA-binding MarR family transcriptional regulator